MRVVVMGSCGFGFWRLCTQRVTTTAAAAIVTEKVAVFQIAQSLRLDDVQTIA
jgi:hypothetical protein